MPAMRTTLTLEDDVARKLRDRTSATGASFKDVVNETLRAGLRAGDVPGADQPPFVVTPKAGGFRPGIDLLRLNDLNDELELEEALAKLARTAGREGG